MAEKVTSRLQLDIQDKDVLLHSSKLPTVIQQVLDTKRGIKPNLLAEFLVRLSRKVSVFYRNCQILKVSTKPKLGFFTELYRALFACRNRNRCHTYYRLSKLELPSLRLFTLNSRTVSTSSTSKSRLVCDSRRRERIYDDDAFQCHLFTHSFIRLSGIKSETFC